MNTERLLARIQGFLHHCEKQPVGILVTAGGDGRPHAAYMGMIATPAWDRLLTMTAPDSRKVINILENPQVEWLFADEAKAEILYVRGTARVVQEPAEVAAAWRQMPRRNRDYFLSYRSVGMEFLIFETAVESFEYRIPSRNEVHRLDRSELTRRAA